MSERFEIKVKDFDLAETLECGQCFNFKKADDDFYNVTAFGRVLHVGQKEDNLIFDDTTEEEYKSVWEDYFDLAADYGMIKEIIKENSPELSDIIEKNPGIRIMKQDFFETLISFIISQNKQIPQIKQVIGMLSESYGERYKDSFLFPTPESLLAAGEDGIRKCKAGFRAPYITDAVTKYINGEISEKILSGLDTDSAREKLMTIKGVGPKVANCVLLYSLHRIESFPVDVWMKRIMEELYFHKDTDKKVIESFAAEKFGRYSGIAQQYLFIYAKEK